MTVYTCACTNRKQLSLYTSHTGHSCAKQPKKACCTRQPICQNEHGEQLGKKACCTTESISLKTEHQPEQVRLNILPTDFFQPLMSENVAEPPFVIAANDIVGSLSRQAIPPKIPIIYQHSCLRL